MKRNFTSPIPSKITNDQLTKHGTLTLIETLMKAIVFDDVTSQISKLSNLFNVDVVCVLAYDHYQMLTAVKTGHEWNMSLFIEGLRRGLRSHSLLRANPSSLDYSYDLLIDHFVPPIVTAWKLIDCNPTILDTYLSHISRKNHDLLDMLTLQLFDDLKHTIFSDRTDLWCFMEGLRRGSLLTSLYLFVESDSERETL